MTADSEDCSFNLTSDDEEKGRSLGGSIKKSANKNDLQSPILHDDDFLNELIKENQQLEAELAVVSKNSQTKNTSKPKDTVEEKYKELQEKVAEARKTLRHLEANNLDKAMIIEELEEQLNGNTKDKDTDETQELNEVKELKDKVQSYQLENNRLRGEYQKLHENNEAQY
jgi:chromosome segregation ATPase